MPATVVAIIIATWGSLRYGSIYALPALIQGKILIVQPGVIDLGTTEQEHKYEANFILTNISSVPIMINGVKASCTCMAADKLPIEIPSYSRRLFKVNYKPTVGKSGKSFKESAELYLNVPTRKTTLTIMGNVKGNGPAL